MKKRVLIINFGDHKSIVSSGELISRVNDDERYGAISMLVFEEYRSSALVLNNVEEILTIDRVSIRSLFNNKVYPKYFALNLFLDTIKRIENGNFNLIVNYSGDVAASYISGHLLSNLEIYGPHYSFKNNHCHTSDWSIVNEMAEEINFLPFCRNDTLCRMMGLKFFESNNGYVVREKHEKTVKHSLNKLRALNRHKGNDPKVVGVCVSSEKKSNSIPTKLVMDLLREIRGQKGLLPLVITGTSDEDENISRTLNERFGHSLTLVKMDVVAAPSLIKGIDILICSDTHYKSLADIVGTQVLELSFGGMPILGGMDGSIVMTSVKKASDIVKVVVYALGGDKSDKLHTDSDAAVYRKERSAEGTFCKKINEGEEGIASIHRIMARNAVMLRFHHSSDFDKKFHYLLQHNGRESLNRWINSERKLVAEMMKEILSVIRLVLMSQKDRGKTKELAYKFDSLFSYEKTKSPVKIPILFLRGLIFSTNKSHFVLEEIYKTKIHLQRYNLLLEELDTYQRKGRFVPISENALRGVDA